MKIDAVLCANAIEACYIKGELRYNVLEDFAKLAAEGRFSVPIARTFALEDWREALDLSLSGHAHGKLVLLPAGVTAKV